MYINLTKFKLVNMECIVPNKQEMFFVLTRELFQQIHSLYKEIKTFICQINNETNFRFQIKNFKNEIECIILDKLTTRVSLLKCKDGFNISSHNQGIELGYLGEKAKEKIKLLEPENFRN